MGNQFKKFHAQPRELNASCLLSLATGHLGQADDVRAPWPLLACSQGPLPWFFPSMSLSRSVALSLTYQLRKKTHRG